MKVARNVERENIEDAVERVSDSIVAKVVKTRRPLILSDALEHPEFVSGDVDTGLIGRDGETMAAAPGGAGTNTRAPAPPPCDA